MATNMSNTGRQKKENRPLSPCPFLEKGDKDLSPVPLESRNLSND